LKHLIKLYTYIIIFFLLIFLVMNFTGLLSVSDIKYYVQAVSSRSTYIIAWVIFLLLASDVFFSVPTVFLVTSAGYLLGFRWGFVASVGGMFASGLIARLLCLLFGKRILKWVLGDDEKISEVHMLFRRFGSGVLLVSRALPMLPEATSCMSGINRMKWGTFVLYYLLGTVPYAAVLVYLGSVSSRENPYPAVGGIVGMYAVLWAVWYFLMYRRKK
jgi:uncharacterized membrane protein YdjX (TVP38/TMEM64 family)